MLRFRHAAIFLLSTLAPALHAADMGIAAKPGESTMTVGLGAAILPEYSGSDKVRAVPIVVADYQHASGFFASTVSGIGYKTKVGPVSLSGALGFAGRRSDRDHRFSQGSDALAGMGDIKSSALGVFGVGYEFDSGFGVGLRAMMALTNRERGNSYELGVQRALIKSEADQVGVYMSATYSDKKNMQAFYGVTAAQSLTSGYKRYDTKAGFSRVSAGANWNHKLNKEWSVNTMAGVVGVVGDAADSPIVKRKTAPVLAVTVNYAF
ncbi:MipA/OmpV family protein [Massilia antarctica]|uniref:MipA/OmpV family protein n=1 Tax=Massilia antarctica TaxID=2765360 RepID=UPI0006BB7F94|nr:MipA/OmpV family protein [Massilia sp. H27-R4]MCY0912757.1 MipA/OmpV family protein [Massilia sp. H27-R4]CUI03828.1 Outer membrane protein V [Janthinobacterium sp. CG23_2]CUU27614.1 Outer membrane protein V [Janthinobacterium sp. CG23_2]